MAGNPLLRYGSLAVIVLQTTVLVLLLRYSRTTNNGQPYIASTAVLSSEVAKFIICLTSLFVSTGYSLQSAYRAFRDEIVLSPWETAKLMVPSGLYAMQNNLLFVALSNLDAATYQVTYQLKILTTALFSVFLLKKHITSMQWVSLLVLTVGVALVQLPEEAAEAGEIAAEATEEEDGKDQHINRTVGLAAVLTACFSSGLAGVYFEMLVKKGKQTSIVIRNLQLGIFSLVFASLAVIWNDLEGVLNNKGGFFQGYTWAVWTVVSIQAVGGLVVAVAVKYADNILKVFATSVSIVLSTVCSYLVLDDLRTGPFFVPGAAMVILSTLIYGKFAAAAPPPSSSTETSPAHLKPK